jgi:hypothetical protein
MGAGDAGKIPAPNAIRINLSKEIAYASKKRETATIYGSRIRTQAGRQENPHRYVKKTVERFREEEWIVCISLLSEEGSGNDKDIHYDHASRDGGSAPVYFGCNGVCMA